MLPSVVCNLQFIWAAAVFITKTCRGNKFPSYTSGRNGASCHSDISDLGTKEWAAEACCWFCSSVLFSSVWCFRVLMGVFLLFFYLCSSSQPNSFYFTDWNRCCRDLLHPNLFSLSHSDLSLLPSHSCRLPHLALDPWSVPEWTDVKSQWVYTYLLTAPCLKAVQQQFNFVQAQFNFWFIAGFRREQCRRLASTVCPNQVETGWFKVDLMLTAWLVGNKSLTGHIGTHHISQI